jgi:hypothetical protein
MPTPQSSQIDVIDAQDGGLPVTMCVLKFNPARRLYERSGFAIVGEIETHYPMEALPPA